MKRRFLPSLVAAIGLGLFGIGSYANNPNRGSEDTSAIEAKILNNYYSEFRSESQENPRWYGKSNSRDLVLKGFYNQYLKLKREDKVPDIYESYSQDEINNLFEFREDFINFSKKNPEFKFHSFFINLVDAINDIERYDRDKFILRHLVFLREIEYIAYLKDSNLYSISNFNLLEKHNITKSEDLIILKNYSEEIEKRGKTTHKKVPYFYGNVKKSLTILITLYGLKNLYEEALNFSSNPSFSESNNILGNLDPHERNKAYNEETQELDLSKVNKNLFDEIIKHSLEEDINPRIVLTIALKENNFGNFFVSDEKAFGPLQVKRKPFFDMIGKNIEDYSTDADKFHISLVAGIKYLAYLNRLNKLNLGFNSTFDSQDKEFVQRFLFLGALYYSGIGEFLARQGDFGLTVGTKNYIEKLYSSLKLNFKIEK